MQMMKGPPLSLKKRFLALLVVGACLVTAQSAMAGVLQRIAETGVLRAGTRLDAIPFAFPGKDGAPNGFSVDLLEEIREAAEKRLGRPIKMDLSIVTSANRFEKIRDGDVDIVCEISTPTWQREKLVDFTIPFFRDGTRILVFRDTLRTTPEVKDMVVGIAEGTTTAAILEQELPGIVTKTYPTMDDAFAALTRGEVQGVANIGIILLGLARKIDPNRSVVLLPRTEPLSNEAMACVLPQGDSEWRDFVNQTIVGLTSGLADYRGRYMELYDKWFGRDGIMVYPLDRTTRDYLLQTNIWSR